MKKLLAFLLFCAPAINAANIYTAQASTGANDGSSCANARTVASLAAGDWAAGNILHLCGTITSGFSVQGSGSSGNVITVKWESGARVSVASGGIININGAKSFLLFDGGTACGPLTTCYTNESGSPTGYPANITGIIEATANGSALANQNVSTQAFYGCDGCHDIEFKNLIVRNLYQHTLLTDSTSSADTGSFVMQCSSAMATACSGVFSIHDSDMHDTGNAISIEKNSAATWNIFNNEMWHNNWEIENSGNGTRTVFVHNNHWHDAKNWDTSAGGGGTFHHNGAHNYLNTSSDSLGYYVYNNRVDGDWGTCCATANFLFTEVAPPANYFVWNNVVIQSCSTNTEPANQNRTQNAGAGATQYNNTYFGCAATGSNVNASDLYGTGQDFRNNAIEGYGQNVVTGSTATFTNLDYNIYGAIGMSGNPPWQCGATGDASFAAWQASCSGDSHGQKVASIGVNTSTGAPNVGSALIGAGVNLTSLCTGNLVSLCSDINGTARPTGVTAWDAGATQFTSLPSSPTNLQIIILSNFLQNPKLGAACTAFNTPGNLIVTVNAKPKAIKR